MSMQTKKRLNRPKRRNGLRNAAIICIMIGVIVPFVPILLWSFAFRWPYPDMLPSFSLRAWSYVFSQKKIIGALFTSLSLSSVVTLVSLAIGFPAARALGMYKFRGKGFAGMFINLPAIVPVLAVAMGIQVIFIRLGLANSFLGVVLIHLVPTLPYMIMNLVGVFENYQADFEYQARNLGCPPLKSIFLITVPILFPGIAVACLQSFLVSWTQYLLTRMIGGSKVETLPTVLFAFLGGGDYPVAAAVSIVFILPAILLLVLTSKYLVGSKGGSNP